MERRSLALTREELQAVLKKIEKGIPAIETDLVEKGIEVEKIRRKVGKKLLYGVCSLILIAIVAGGIYLLIKDRAKPAADMKIEPKKEAEALTEGPFKAGWTNSIAVLPFRNLSPEAEQEYFCDGMTEQLITNLTHIKDLKVILFCA